MATLYGVNATKRDVTTPSVKINVNNQGGRVRHAYDSYTLLAEAAIGDIIKLMKLPAGAKLIDARLIAPSDGLTGQWDLGWAAYGSEVTDQNGIFGGAAEGDTGGGAVDSKLLGVAPGYNKEFNAEVQLQLEAIEATTGSTGDEIQVEVSYVLD